MLSQVKAVPGSHLKKLLDQKLSENERIAAIFRRFLTRDARPEEMAMARDVVKTSGGAKGYEDLQWLLVNKVDFLFNY